MVQNLEGFENSGINMSNRLAVCGGFLGTFGAPGSPPPGRIPLSAWLFCGQYTTSGLFLPCQQGTRCGLFDEMSDGHRLRHIHGVAAFDLDDR